MFTCLFSSTVADLPAFRVMTLPCPTGPCPYCRPAHEHCGLDVDVTVVPHLDLAGEAVVAAAAAAAAAAGAEVGVAGAGVLGVRAGWVGFEVDPPELAGGGTALPVLASSTGLFAASSAS
jgi:hypothetical protein